MTIYDEALEYHSKGRKGKIEVIPSKAVSSQKDLSLAYSPGVAEPCRQIADDKNLVYEYTAKGNLVAVITNGSAVLGLGGIGPHAAKPVMEGKGILFKKFADIDVFDIELDTTSPDDVIKACRMLEPTFGGINLEDIKAPECFYIEEECRKRLKIPVFHDDQHGTAVISGAAFLNALEITRRDITKVKIVVCGGGAAAIACATLYVSLGVKKENIIMTDSKGVIYKGRTQDMNPYKERFASDTPARSLADAMVGADAFLGLSVKGVVSPEMIKSMAKDPIIFAMANPDPEITPEEVAQVRSDAIVATGRSDYPNQVNNVLGFPYIFRGALDTRATDINDEMKMAAVKALAALAKQDIPEAVSRAYGGRKFKFGRDYLIPTPFDQRALIWVASAVAEAAMQSGVARIKFDLREYRLQLEARLGTTYTIMRGIKTRVQKSHSNDNLIPKIVLPEGHHSKILKAASALREEEIAEPILLGNTEKIKRTIAELRLEKHLDGIQIIQPTTSPLREEFAQEFYRRRERKGATHELARQFMKNVNYFGSMMVDMGHADGVLSGISQSYPDTIRPAIQIIGVKPGAKLAGLYLMVIKKRVMWFADTTVNIDPSAEELAQIAIQTAEFAKGFMEMEPKVAMLSFSNFGSNRHPYAEKVARATELVRRLSPNLKVDGEMQADTALLPEISKENFPFNQVAGDANVLIFPDLQSGNIAYKLMQRIAGADAVGPILLGMKKPVSVLQRGSDVDEIINMAAITAMEVQRARKRTHTHPEST